MAHVREVKQPISTILGVANARARTHAHMLAPGDTLLSSACCVHSSALRPPTPAAIEHTQTQVQKAGPASSAGSASSAAGPLLKRQRSAAQSSQRCLIGPSGVPVG